MKFSVLSKNGVVVMNLNRRKAIREQCLNCVGWIHSEVRNCDFTWCALHPYRMGTGKQDAADRAASIRKYCLQCCNDQPVEVRWCPCRDCSLYPYRKAKADKSVEIKTGTADEQLEAVLKENRNRTCIQTESTAPMLAASIL